MGSMKTLASGAWAVFREAESEAGHPGQQTVVRECMLKLWVLRRWMKSTVVGRRGQDPRDVGSGGGFGRERGGRKIEKEYVGTTGVQMERGGGGKMGGRAGF